MWSALVLGLAGGCTPTLDFLQCRDSLDCANGEGTPLICDQGSCVEPGSPAEVQCDDRQDCAQVFGANHVCLSQGVCASLLSSECDTLVQPADPDNAIYIGSILPTSPPFTATILPVQNAVQLAVEDFNQVAALPGGRRVGWIGCDSRGSAETAVLAAEHLVGLGVPAIVGPGLSENVVAVAEQVTLDEGVFTISPTATAESITSIADDGLVWRTIASDAYQVSAITDRVAELEPPPAKILVLAKDDAYGRGLLEGVIPGIEAVLPETDVASLFYPDPTALSPELLLSRYGDVIAQGFGQSANVVLIFGTSEARDLILFYLQTRDQQNPPPPVPRFLVSHGAVPILTQVVSQVNVAFRDDLMPKLEGTSPIVQDPLNFAPYNIRYTIRFTEQETLTASSLGYDAGMVVLLALAGAPSFDGHGVAAAVAKLIDKQGQAIGFRDGLQFIADAVGVLEAEGTVDLEGVSGALDFDLVTGDVRSDLIGWGLVPKVGEPETPVLTAERRYLLDDAPAETGSWMDL